MGELSSEIARKVWTTVETSVRGFLLGFGAVIMKDIWLDRKASGDADYTSTIKLARIAGLGSASFLVGAAIVVAAQWRAHYVM